MISLSSVAVSVAAILSALIFPTFHLILDGYDPLFTVIIIIIASLIIIRHKDNMLRIKNKEENLVPWGLNLSQQKKKKN